MKIENMKKVELGTIKAFFDVNFTTIKVKGFKLIMQSGQRMWCSSPDEKYTDKNGKQAYKKIVEILDLPLAAKISAAAIEEYEK